MQRGAHAALDRANVDHTLQTQLHPSNVGFTGPSPAPQDRLVSCDGDVIPQRRHGNAVSSPPTSPSQANLFNKLTQERNDRLCIRTFAQPVTSLYGSKEPAPPRLYKKPVAASDEASVIQDQLQMRLVELQAREKLAKRAKGGMVALPLNVTSPEDRSTRRLHNNQRYM